MLSLIAFIPGAGNVIGAAAELFASFLRCRVCLVVAAGLALFAIGDLRGHYIERGKCSARIEADHRAAAAAATKRDKDIKAELQEKFSPQLDQLRAENETLKSESTRNDKAILSKIAGGRCRLGPAALRLRDGAH